MSNVFFLSTLKLASRVFYAMAGISLFLVIFITPPLMRLLDYHLIFGMIELLLVPFALFLVPVFFVVMALLTRRLDEDIFRHYARPSAPEKEKQPK